MGLFNGLYKDYGMPKEKVLEWQKLISGIDNSKVKMSKQQLINATQLIIDDHNRIIQDCVRLVNDTLTPAVFFEKYDTLIMEMSALIQFEPFYHFNKSISEQVGDLRNKRPQNEIAFINKSYEATLKAANSLKTQKGKANRINNFFEIMNTYKSRMQPDAQRHLEKLEINRK